MVNGRQSLPLDLSIPGEDVWPRAIFDHVVDAIVVIDPYGFCLDANRAAYRLIGYGSDDLIGVPIYTLIPILTHPTPVEFATWLAQPDIPPRTVSLRRPDEQLVEIEVQIITNLIPGRYLVVLHDLTGERRHKHELAALAQAGAVLTSSLELKPLLENILQAAIYAIPAADKGTLLLLDDSRQTLTIRAMSGYTDPRILSIEFPLTAGYAARAVREGQPLLIPDARTDFQTGYEDQIPEMVQVLSAAVAPLLVKGRCIGVISLDNSHRPAAFQPEDLHLLVTFAGHAALAIDHARLFEDERRERRLAETLREVGASLTGTLDINAVLDRVLQQVGRVIPYDGANIMLVAGDMARIVRHLGYEGYQVSQRVLGQAFPWRHVPYIRRLIETGQPQVATDTAQDREWTTMEPGLPIASWIGSPMRVRGPDDWPAERRRLPARVLPPGAGRNFGRFCGPRSHSH